MREIVRGGTKKEVQRKIDSMIARNPHWRPVSEIKEDPSTISYNVVEWVCVMERPGQKPEKGNWGKRS